MDACTPFVYGEYRTIYLFTTNGGFNLLLAVSRPLFIEEHGLRLLLSQEGVGEELSRAAYEAGDWASAVLSAYENGRMAKERLRVHGWSDVRQKAGGKMAEDVMQWVKGFWN